VFFFSKKTNSKKQKPCDFAILLYIRLHTSKNLVILQFVCILDSREGFFYRKNLLFRVSQFWNIPSTNFRWIMQTILIVCFPRVFAAGSPSYWRMILIRLSLTCETSNQKQFMFVGFVISNSHVKLRENVIPDSLQVSTTEI